MNSIGVDDISDFTITPLAANLTEVSAMGHTMNIEIAAAQLNGMTSCSPDGVNCVRATGCDGSAGRSRRP